MIPLKIAVPDLVSNSYFPAIAAIDLGCFAQEQIEASIELIFPVSATYQALQAGAVDLVAGSAHSAASAFPDWDGVRLLCAQGQGMYWFLVMRADLQADRGDLSVVKGRRIGAAPWVEMGLRRLLADSGVDIAKDAVQIAPVPGAAPSPGQVVNFGVTAARALADGKIDGFWANGMGAELAVQDGAGSIVLDVRRGDGPAEAFDYTFASIAARDAFTANNPDAARGAIRAMRSAHALLRNDPTLAARISQKRFPPREAGLIVELVRRDLPYYDLAITERSAEGLSRFSLDMGIVSRPLRYNDIVASMAPECW